MDRRLIGVLTICLVFSTTVTLLIVGERSKGATILENRFPDKLYRSRTKGSFTFHYGLVSRQSFEVLTLDFYALRRIDRNLTLDLDQSSLEELGKRIPSGLWNMTSALGIPPMFLGFETRLGDEAMTLKLLDFSRVFEGIMPRGVVQYPETHGAIATSPSPTVCFAFIFDSSGRLNSSYEGVRDFFFDRELTLTNLYFRQNENVSSFVSYRSTPQPVGRRLLDSPWPAHLAFYDIKRDDRIEVGFSVNSIWLEGNVNMVQIILVHGNEDLLFSQANFIPSDGTT